MIRSFFIGLLHACRGWKMILLLLVANNLVTIPLVLPIFWLVAATTSGTLTADRMFANQLDARWLIDVYNQQMPGFSIDTTGVQIGLLLAFLVLIYLLMNTFFAGGIIEVLAADYGHFTMRRFWGGCGAYFWRLFRLMIISLIFYGIAGFLFYLATMSYAEAEKQATAFESIVYRRWGSVALLVLLLAFINMVFDYAKIRAVVEDSRAMLAGSFRALGFALQHFFSVTSLYGLIVMVGLALFIMLARARGSLAQSSVTTITGAVLLGQTAIAAQIWTRMTFYAAELDFYRRFKPKIVHPAVPEPEGELQDEFEEGVGLSIVARTRSPESLLASAEGLDEHRMPQESEGKQSR